MTDNVTLNKRELKFLSNFRWCSYKWSELIPWRKGYYWGEFEVGSVSVKIGPVLFSLIDKGIVDKFTHTFGAAYKPTARADKYLCRYRVSNVESCNNGRIFRMDDEIGPCPECNGIGLIPHPAK
jgi:hypothetical protein